MELIVPDDKLSLAIGKKGQNVRLASQLTGWRIDIHSESKVREMEARARQSMAAIKSGDDGGGLPTATIEALFHAGFRSAGEVAAAKADELAAIAAVGGNPGAQALIVAAAQAAEIERARQLEVEEAARAAREAAALAEPEAAAAPSPGASPEVRHG
jgi:N utilization substance protein A